MKTSGYKINLDNPELQKIIIKWTKGNQDAARLIYQFYAIARIADDIVDEKDCNQDTIVALLEMALVHIAGNPFYQQFFGQLSAVVFEMLVYWKISDDFRKTKDEKKNQFGFIWRNSVDRSVIVIAAIIGGSGHADKVAKELFAISHQQSDETIEQWIGDE